MTDGDDYVFAEPEEKFDGPEYNVYDCGHNRLIHLRREVDIFTPPVPSSIAPHLGEHNTDQTLNEGAWETAILCSTCIDAINNNPDDPREVFPSGTREDQ